MGKIVDAWGNPIETATLTDPQTAKIGWLQQMYALHPAKGLTPARLHALMVTAENGQLTAQSDLFDDMEERDAHLLAEMSKRRRAILTLEWQVVPPRGFSAAEQSLADEARDLLHDIPEFEGVLLDALSAIGHGFSCLEIEWAQIGSMTLPKKISLRPHSWFRLDWETRTEIRLRSTAIDGEILNPFGWIVHRHQAKSGYLARGGLFRSLAWPYLFKNYAARDLAEFLEIYGLPLRVGTYPAGATADEKSTLMQAVVAIGHSAAGIIPQGMMIDFKEAAIGSQDPHMAMIQWCERTISKAILGQNVNFDTSQKGSLAGMSLDNEVRLDVLKSDARQLQTSITRDLIYPILALNFGLSDISRCPRLVFDVRVPGDLKLYADALPLLADAGMDIPISWAREKLHIPAPVDGEPVMKVQARAAQIPNIDPTAPTTAKAALKAMQASPSVNPGQALAANLRDAAADPLHSWLDTIKAMTEKANSMAELRDMLVNAYGDLPPDQMGSVMALAIAAAKAGGRFDAARQAGLV